MAMNEVPSFFRTRRGGQAPFGDRIETLQDASSSRIKLFRGTKATGVYMSSPFVTKVEFRFRLASVDYETGAGSPWLGPKGKIPYLELSPAPGSSRNGPTMLGDSTLIIQHFMEDGTLPDLNAGLSPSEKARDLGLRSLLEDKLYFYHMRECWVDNYYSQREQALWAVPYPMRILAGRSVYGIVTKTLHGQGAGRYSEDEVQRFRREIWDSFNGLLEAVQGGSKSQAPNKDPFWVLGGEQPTEADVTLFSFITGVLGSKSCPASQKILRGLPAIMDYAHRIHDRYFADYEKWNAEAVQVVDDTDVAPKL